MSEVGVDAGEVTGSPIKIRNRHVGSQDLVEQLRTGVEGAVDVPVDTLLQNVKVARSSQDNNHILFVVVVKLQHQITGKGGAVIIVYLQVSKAG